MTYRPNRILRVLSSIAVGTMAFLIMFPVVLLVGCVLLGPLESEAFLPPQLVVLLVVATLAGLIVAVFVGIKYYRYVVSKSK